MLGRYHLGAEIHKIEKRISTIEHERTTIDTDSAFVKENLKLGYATPLTLCYVDSGNNVVSTTLYDLISVKNNQVTITQNADNSITLGTVQDIGPTSIPTFAGAAVNGNITVTGTVDGVDISSFNNSFTNHTFNSTTAHFGQDLKSTASPSFKKVTINTYPSANSDAATKQYVDLSVGGVDWQKSVLSVYNPTSGTPIGPDIGDRYISSVSGSGWTLNNIYEWNGTIWLETIPNDGYVAFVSGGSINPRKFLLYSSSVSSWVLIDETINHQSITGAGSNTHAQIDSHIANNTTAHFGQDLKSTASPTFNMVNVATVPSLSYHLANKSYVDTMVQNINWQKAVKAFYDPTPSLPLFPANGDRYISLANARGWIVNRIYEWSSAMVQWVETAPNTGYALYVEGGTVMPDTSVTYNGTEWVKFGSTLDHTTLRNIGVYTHAQIDAHIDNNTTAHFGQGLKVTDSPSFVAATLTSTVGSTSKTTGTLKILGGLGVVGAINADSEKLYGQIQSSNISTGTLIVDGGVGITNDLNVGGNVKIYITTNSSDINTGSVIVSGGLAVQRNANFAGPLTVNGETTMITERIVSTLDSSNAQSGAIVVSGGAGIAKNLYVGDSLNVLNSITSNTNSIISTINSLNTTTGALKVLGGVGIVKDVNIGGNTMISGTIRAPTAIIQNISITSSVESISSTTGALVITGGEGISGNLNVGGNTVLHGTLNSGAGTFPTVSITAADNATDTLSGVLRVAGGVSIERNTIVGGNMDVTGDVLQLNSIIRSADESSNINSGALQVAGGAAITKNLNVGGDSHITGTETTQFLIVTSTIDSSAINTGATQIVGGVGIGGNVNVGGNMDVAGFVTIPSLSITTMIESSDPTTGALKVSGGVGIGGNENVGGNMKIGGNTNIIGTVDIESTLDVLGESNFNNIIVNSSNGSTDVITGSIVTPGGIGIGENLNAVGSAVFGGSMKVYSNENALDSNTGSLFVNGGAGIRRDVYIGGKTTISEAISGKSLYISANTNTVSTTAGAVVVVGGMGLGRNLWVGGNTNITGTLGAGATTLTAGLSATTGVFSSNLNAINTLTGALRVAGGASIGRDLWVGGYINVNTMSVSTQIITSTIGSTDTVTGAFRVIGGVGIGENVNIGGDVVIARTLSAYSENLSSLTNSTTTATGALQVLGGVGIGKNLHIGGDENIAGSLTTGSEIITSTTNATDVDTGALRLNGGASIRKDLIVAGSASIYQALTTGSLTVTSTNDSTDTSTGSIRTNGGMGIGKDLYIGGNEVLAGTFTASEGSIRATTEATSISSGSLRINGGVGIMRNLFVGGNTNIAGDLIIRSEFVTATADATDVNSGALQVDGGVGIAKSVVIGDNLTVDGFTSTITERVISTENSSSTSTGALQVLGGVGIKKDLIVGGNIKVTNTLTGLSAILNSTDGSSSISTGSLLINGGVGIGENLNVGGNMAITGTMTMLSELILSTENSNGTVSGALQVAGGVGIGKTTYIGEDLHVLGTTISNLEQILNTLTATDSMTGALQVAGGIGVIKDIYVGESININGTTTTNLAHILNTLNSNSTSTGSLVVDGGIGIAKSMYVGGDINIKGSLAYETSSVHATINSTSTDTGALRVVGGVGIGMNINVGGNMVVAGSSTTLTEIVLATTSTTNSLTGALTVAGGVGIKSDIFVGGNSTVSGLAKTLAEQIISTITSSSITTGALQVSGGVGIVKDVFIGGSETVNGNITTLTETITSTTNAIDTATGALKVLGGVGITKDIFIGGSLTTTTEQITSTSDATNMITGALKVAGGISVTKTAFIDTINVTSTTQSINTLTGAEIISGGVGIGKDLFVGGIIHEISTIDSSSVLTGAVQILGGVGIVKTATIGVVNVTQTTQATSVSTGSLTVSGGVGINSNTYVGGILNIINTTDSSSLTTGSVIVSGGIAVAKTATIGSLKLLGTASSTSTSTGVLTLTGGIGLADNIHLGGQLVVESTTNSVSVNTGSVILSGGIGITKDVIVGGSEKVTGVLTVLNTIASTSTNTGAVVITGGTGIGGNAYIGGIARVASADGSSSYSSGALTVVGGTGVGGSLYVGDTSQSKITLMQECLPVGTFPNQWVRIISYVRGASPGPGPAHLKFITQGALNIDANMQNGSDIVHLHLLWSPNNSFASSAKNIVIWREQMGKKDAPVEEELVIVIYAIDLGLASEEVRVYIKKESYTPMGIKCIVDSSDISSSVFSFPGVICGSGTVPSDLTGYVYTKMFDSTLPSTYQFWAEQHIGKLILRSTENSVSITTGAFVVDGGVGMARDLRVGGNEYVTGIMYEQNTQGSTSSSTGALQVLGGVGIGEKLYVANTITSKTSGDNMTTIMGGNANSIGIQMMEFNNTYGGYVYYDISDRVNIQVKSAGILYDGIDVAALNTFVLQTLNSTSTNTGALQIYGGVGIGKDLYVGGDTHVRALYIDATTESTNVTTGALVVSGGVGIGKNLNVDGNENITGVLKVTNTTISINSTTGSAIISGGVGIAKDLFVAGVANITNTGGNQLTVAYDATKYTTFNTSSGGNLSITASGGQIYTSSLDTVYFQNTINSAGTDSGSIQVAGGIGIAKNIYLGGNETVVGTMTILNTTVSTNTSTGSAIIYGGIGIGGAINAYREGGLSYVASDITGKAVTSIMWDHFTGKTLQSGIATSLYYPAGTYSFGGQSTNYAIRFTGWIKPLYTETYTFTASCDDRVIVYVNNTQLVNAGATGVSGTIALTANVWIPICVECVNGPGLFALRVIWQSTSQTSQDIPAASMMYNQMAVPPSSLGTTVVDGVMTIVNTTPSASNTSGAFVVNGGVGINKTLYVGDSLFVGKSIESSSLRLNSASNISYIQSNSAKTYGQWEDIVFSPWLSTTPEYLRIGSTYVKVPTTANALSTASGAFQVVGGVGIGKDLYVGGIETVLGTTQSINTTTGAFTVAGGAGIGGNLNVGGTLSIIGALSAPSLTLTDTTQASSTSTGTLKVTGGIGAGGNIYSGGKIQAEHVSTSGSFGWYTYNINPTGLWGGVVSQYSPTSLSDCMDKPTVFSYNSVSNTLNPSAPISYRHAVFANYGSNHSPTDYGLTIDVGAENSDNMMNGRFTELTMQGGWSSTRPNIIFRSDNGVSIQDTNISSSDKYTKSYLALVPGDTTSANSATITYVKDIASNDGAYITIGNITESSGTTSGSLVVSGGVGIAKKLNVNGDTKIFSATASTSKTDGAFVVTGGVGVSGSIFSNMSNVRTTTNNTIINSNLATGLSSGTFTHLTLGQAETNYNCGVMKYWFSSSGSTSNYLEFGLWGMSGTNHLQLLGTGVTKILGGIQSSDKTTGTLVLTGGLGVSLNANVGGDLGIVGTLKVDTIQRATVAGLNIANDTQVTINNTTQSVGTNSGSLIVSGGVGIAGRVYSSELHAANTHLIPDSSLPANTGGFGLYITSGYASPYIGRIFIGDGSSWRLPFCKRTGSVSTDVITLYDYGKIETIGDIITSSTTVSSNTTTGALIVAGGLGVGKKINAGDTVKVLVNSATNYYSAYEAFNSGLTANQRFVVVQGGLSNTAQNTGAMTFYYSASGSASNHLEFQLNGTSDCLNIYNTYVAVPKTTASSTYTNGSLVVSGGVGVTGDTHTNGSIYLDNNTSVIQLANNAALKKRVSLYDSYSDTTRFYGFGVQADELRVQVDRILSHVSFGAGTGLNTDQEVMRIEGDLAKGVTIYHTMASTSPTSGSLVIGGGLGVGGAINAFKEGGLSYYVCDSTGKSYLTMDRNQFTGKVLQTGITNTLNYPSGVWSFGGQSTSYSIRFVGWIKPLYSETYTFTFASDDYGVLYINNVQVAATSGGTTTGTIALTANVWIPILVEYINGPGNMTLRVQWQSTSQSIQDIPAANMAYDNMRIPPPILGTTYVNGVMTNTNTTVSNSTSTGALTVNGGVGIGGNLNVGGSMTIPNLDVSGTIKVDQLQEYNAGQGIDVLAGTDVFIRDTTDSGAVNTGALQVAGGIFVAKKIYTGDTTTNSTWNQLLVNSTSTGNYGGSSIASVTGRSTVVADLGIESPNALFFVQNDNPYVSATDGRAASIGFRTKSYNWGSGNVMTTWGRICGINKYGINNYNGQLNFEVQYNNSGGLKTMMNVTDAGVKIGPGVASSISGTMLDIDGNISLTSAIDYQISVTNSAAALASGFFHGAQFLKALMGANETYNIHVGRANSSKDLAYFGFKYSGTSGSTENCATIGLHGSDHLLSVYSSKITMPITTAATSSTTGALIISGGVGVASNCYIGGKLSAGNDTISYGGGSDDLPCIKAINQTPTTASVLNDPKYVLKLERNGTSSVSWAAGMRFGISRYVNSGVDAKTRIDIDLIDTSAYTNFMKLYSEGILSITSSINSINATTGALIIGGGVGISGNTYTNGILVINNSNGMTINGTATSFTSALQFTNTSGSYPTYQIIEGGSANTTSGVGPGVFGIYDSATGKAGFAIKASSSQILDNYTTQSTSATTGALIVSGGVGIAGNLNVGGTFGIVDLNVSGTLSSSNTIVNRTVTTAGWYNMTCSDIYTLNCAIEGESQYGNQTEFLISNFDTVKSNIRNYDATWSPRICTFTNSVINDWSTPGTQNTYYMYDSQTVYQTFTVSSITYLNRIDYWVGTTGTVNYKVSLSGGSVNIATNTIYISSSGMASRTWSFGIVKLIPGTTYTLTFTHYGYNGWQVYYNDPLGIMWMANGNHATLLYLNGSSSSTSNFRLIYYTKVNPFISANLPINTQFSIPSSSQLLTLTYAGNGSYPTGYGSGDLMYDSNASSAVYTMTNSSYTIGPSLTVGGTINSSNQVASSTNHYILTANLPGGGQNEFVIGVATSENNAAEIGLIYTSAGSTSNFIRLCLWGHGGQGVYIYNDHTTVAADTASNSTSTGALVVSGGVGIAGDLNIGGTFGTANINISGTTKTDQLQEYNSGQGIDVIAGTKLYIRDTTNASGSATGAFQVSGGCSIGNNTYISGLLNVGNGPATIPARLILNGQEGQLFGPHIMAYGYLDQTHPMYQQLNWEHNNIAFSFDSYWNGSAWTAAHTSPSYQIYKSSNVLRFNYAPATTAGTAASFSTAFEINSSGQSRFYQPVTMDSTLYTSGVITSFTNGENMMMIRGGTAHNLGIDMRESDAGWGAYIFWGTTGEQTDRLNMGIRTGGTTYDGIRIGSGYVLLPLTANSTSYNSGALQIAGGVGISSDLFVNSKIQFTNYIGNKHIVMWDSYNDDYRFYGLGIQGGTLNFRVDSTGAQFSFRAGLSSSGDQELMRIPGNLGAGVVIMHSAASTSITTGALLVNGGVGIMGNLNIGGTINSNYGILSSGQFIPDNIGGSLHAKLDYELGADYILYSTDVIPTYSGVYISGGKAIIPNAAYMYYLINSSVDGGTQFTIRFKFTPDYSGYPSSNMDIVQLTNGSDNQAKVVLYHWSDGRHGLYVFTDGGGVYSHNWTSGYSMTSGREYEYEIAYTNASGTRVFVDGTQIIFNGQTGRSASRPRIHFGAASSQFRIRELVMYNYCVHTSNYTPGYTVPSCVIGSGVHMQKNLRIDGNMLVSGYTNQTATYGYLNSVGAVGTSSGTNAYSIVASYRVRCPEFNAVSDRRIKSNIVTFNNDICYSLVNRLVVRHYTRNDDPCPKVGFIAQEVEDVLPNCVTQVENGDIKDFRVLDHSQITAINTGAINHISTEITVLREENIRLKEENSTLKSRVDLLELKLNEILAKLNM